MENVNDGSLPSIFLLQLLSLKILQYSSLIIPIGLFFGILISLNRLYTSNEMVIMKLGGYSSRLISIVLTKMIVTTALVVMLFNFFITPFAIDSRIKIQHQVMHEQKIYSLSDGRFNHSSDNSKIIYINNINSSQKGNVFIKSKHKDATRIDISSKIVASDKDIITLKDGNSYSLSPVNGISSTRYVNQSILLSNKIPKQNNIDLEAKSISQLIKMDNNLSYLEILRRVSMIIATIILGYLAIPLSHVNQREDKYRNIFIGVFFYFIYIVLINILSKTLNDIVVPFMFVISLHLFFALLTYKYFNYSDSLKG